MSRPSLRRSRSALWRGLLACVIAGAVAFAPVARAVCDLQHVAASVHQQGGCHEDPAQPATGSVPADQDTCCDGALAAMTPQAVITTDAGAAAFAGLNAVVPSSRSFALFPVRVVLPRGHALPPPEPVLRRLPRRLT